MTTYIPKPDPEGINSSSDEKTIQDALVLIFGFLAAIVIFFFLIGFVTEKLVQVVPLESEIKYFSKISQLTESKQNEELKKIQQKIQKHISFNLDMGIVCDETPNAFAYPGAKIVLTSGLFDNIKTENGLIFVIGHEIGHVLNRDHLQGFGRQIAITAVLAVLGMSDSNSFINLANLPLRSFQKNQELKADENGLLLLKKIYGHSEGADEFFISVEKNKNNTEKVLSTFFSTHPASEERIEKIKKLGVENKSGQKTSILNIELLKADCQKP